jgi:hypothetical protein
MIADPLYSHGHEWDRCDVCSGTIRCLDCSKHVFDDEPRRFPVIVWVIGAAVVGLVAVWWWVSR